jgi:hypothetical protein
MAHYFPDRRIIRELFKIDIVPDKLYVQCAIYERFEFRANLPCTCGQKTSKKFSKTQGVSTKISATIATFVEGSLGVAGLAQLKTSIQATLGAEVNWSESRTEETNFECAPPKCGSCDLTIYQLVREHELAIYRKGGGIFRPGFWDKKWSGTIPEEVESYAEVPDCLEWDDKCKCPPRHLNADYDGRVSVDFGDICILAPYKFTDEGIKIRLAKLVVSFPFYKYADAVTTLLTGLTMTFQRSFLPKEALFLGNLQGESYAANVRFYRDPGAATQPLEENLLKGSPSVEQIPHHEPTKEFSEV